MLTILILCIICLIVSFSNYFDLQDLKRDYDNAHNHLLYLDNIIHNINNRFFELLKGKNKNEKK